MGVTPIDFDKELADFFAAMGHGNSGLPLPDRTRLILREGSEYIGHLADAIDEENRDVELPLLKKHALTALQKAIGELELPRLAASIINGALPTIVPVTIDAAVDKSHKVWEVRDKYLKPSIDFAIDLLLDIRNGFFPPA